MKYILFLLLCVFSLVNYVYGHASLTKPCPRFDTSCNSESNLPSGEVTDPDIRSPIGSATTGTYLPICKTSKEWTDVVDTLEAGSSYTVKFSSESISHSGGHCEFSISYDNAESFVVLHQVLQFCFVGSKPSAATNEVKVHEYTFDLPSDLPGADRAIFAWTWVNASGNREFYMNCADVAVTGTSTSYSGKGVTFANYKDYPTIPEMSDDYSIGLELYDMSLNPITVTSNGGSGKTSSKNNKDNTKSNDKSSGDEDSSDKSTSDESTSIESTSHKSKSHKSSSSTSTSDESSSDSDQQTSSVSDDNSETADSSSTSSSVKIKGNIKTSAVSDTSDGGLDKCDMDETGDYSDVNADNTDENVSDTSNDSSEPTTSDDGYDYVCDTGDETSSTDDGYDYVCDTGSDESSGGTSPSSTTDTTSTKATSTSIAGPVWNSSEEPELVCDGTDEESTITSDTATTSGVKFSSSAFENTALTNISSSISTGKSQSATSIVSTASSASLTSSESEQLAKSSAPTTTDASSTESTSSRTFVLFEYSSVASASNFSGSSSNQGSAKEIETSTEQSQSVSQSPTSSPLPTASTSVSTLASSLASSSYY